MIKIRNPKPQRNQGFTLLELLIVVGIIAILISILALGGRSVMKTVKINATKVTLDNLVSLQAEYEAGAGKLPDFIQGRFVRADQLANLQLGGNTPDYHAVYTQRALRLMNMNPKVKASFKKMPSDSIAVVDAVWAPYIASPADQSWKSPGLNFNYLKGDVVKYNSHFYQCNGASVPNAVSVPSAAYPWTDLGTTNLYPVYVPIDAWGNAIRFVGALGMDRLKVDPKSSKLWYGPNPDDPAETLYANQAAPDPSWLPLKPEHWFKRKFASPSYTPFWVSAGPDGDFTTHDDNLYSFEN